MRIQTAEDLEHTCTWCGHSTQYHHQRCMGSHYFDDLKEVRSCFCQRNREQARYDKPHPSEGLPTFVQLDELPNDLKLVRDRKK